jgi:hypothetical protein
MFKTEFNIGYLINLKSHKPIKRFHIDTSQVIHRPIRLMLEISDSTHAILRYMA